ncbi:MAG: hypothetical protein K2X93_25830 [Candidatus Obscuribacterales bacterium]|nr:hypothetical protein [Candidatus Obscuribacterales bacterium]
MTRSKQAVFLSLSLTLLGAAACADDPDPSVIDQLRPAIGSPRPPENQSTDASKSPSQAQSTVNEKEPTVNLNRPVSNQTQPALKQPTRSVTNSNVNQTHETSTNLQPAGYPTSNQAAPPTQSQPASNQTTQPSVNQTLPIANQASPTSNQVGTPTQSQPALHQTAQPAIQTQQTLTQPSQTGSNQIQPTFNQSFQPTTNQTQSNFHQVPGQSVQPTGTTTQPVVNQSQPLVPSRLPNPLRPEEKGKIDIRAHLRDFEKILYAGSNDDKDDELRLIALERTVFGSLNSRMSVTMRTAGLKRVIDRVSFGRKLFDEKRWTEAKAELQEALRLVGKDFKSTLKAELFYRIGMCDYELSNIAQSTLPRSYVKVNGQLLRSAKESLDKAHDYYKSLGQDDTAQKIATFIDTFRAKAATYFLY